MSENVEAPKEIVKAELTEEERKNMLLTLAAVEEVLNEGAVKIAHKYRVPDGKWRIHLVFYTKGAPILRIKGGAVAQIILTWPEAKKELKRLLEDAFKAISRNNIIEPFALQTTLYARQMKEATRKWIREECGEESEILLDLVGKTRLKYTTTVTKTLTDTKTGLSVSVTTSSDDHYNERKLDQWIQLSRLVREKEAVNLDDLLPDEEENE